MMGDKRAVSSTVKKFQSGVACIEGSDGGSLTSTADNHTVLREYWSGYFLNPNFESEMKPIDIEGLCKKPHSSSCDRAVSLEQLEAVRKKLQPRKSQGLDGIHPKFLKDACPSLRNAIVTAFNNILKTGIFPEKWKNDRRTPIHKKGSKRLLAIHSVFRKVFSTIIERRKR